MINESRRSYNNRCYYWKVDKKNPAKQDLVIQNECSGIFFAKEAQTTSKSDQLDSGIINIEQQITVIESIDDLSKLDHKDIVKYLGQYWIIDDIRSQIRNKTTEYYARPERIWWLTLRNRG